jgi:hypothetical protein
MSVWTDHERAVLGTIGDVVIPAGGPLPSATEAGVDGPGIDEIAAIRPDLLEAGRAVVAAVGDQVPTTVAELRGVVPALFSAVTELLASAYFLRPDIAAQVGYRARRAIPLDDEDLRRRELVSLVRPVVDRGNVWRVTPG